MSNSTRFADGLFVILIVMAMLLVACGGGGGEKKKSKKAAEKKTEKTDAPKQKPKKKVDPVARKVAKLKRAAKSGRYAALLALGKYCAKHERYADEAKAAFTRILEDDPEDEEALDYLGLALVEDLPMKKEVAVALKKSAWFKHASGVIDSEVKNEQRLRDLGLSYGFQPPFLIVKEREDDVEVDRSKRRKMMRALEPLYPAFRQLLGDDVGLAKEPDAVVPIFWHCTKRGLQTFYRSRQLRHDEAGDRNYMWAVFDDTTAEESLAVRMQPLKSEVSHSMVTASLQAQPMPTWLSTGVAANLAGMSLDAGDTRTVVERKVVDPALLKAVLGDKKRWPVRRLLAKPRLSDELLAALKARGLEDVHVSVFASTSPAEATAFVAYLLHEKPKALTTLLKEYLAGKGNDKLVKKTLGGDLSALDGAWVAWMKSKLEQ